MIILTQDGEVEQITQVFYKKHYFKKHIFAKKMFIGVNLYGYDMKGKKVLLGTFEDEEEARIELMKINSSKDYIKHITIY